MKGFIGGAVLLLCAFLATSSLADDEHCCLIVPGTLQGGGENATSLETRTIGDPIRSGVTRIVFRPADRFFASDQPRRSGEPAHTLAWATWDHPDVRFMDLSHNDKDPQDDHATETHWDLVRYFGFTATFSALCDANGQNCNKDTMQLSLIAHARWYGWSAHGLNGAGVGTPIHAVILGKGGGALASTDFRFTEFGCSPPGGEKLVEAYAALAPASSVKAFPLSDVTGVALTFGMLPNGSVPHSWWQHCTAMDGFKRNGNWGRDERNQADICSKDNNHGQVRPICGEGGPY